MIFLSHALPEDNEFTRWLALRLAKEGYPVWCDLTKLLGGEDFWNDIEDAIRNRTSKFLFVLSKVSNEKPGALQELALAKRVGKEKTDFVIPLRIDNLPSDETTIELTRLNSIDFTSNWVDGLVKLLEKLEKDHVPKDPRFGPPAVARWWQEYVRDEGALKPLPESVASNWFKIEEFPEEIHLHSLLGGKKNGDGDLPMDFPYRRFKSGVFSFEKARALNQALQEMGMTVSETKTISLFEFQQFGDHRLRIMRDEARRILTFLFREAFERHCRKSGLRKYALAGDATCYWFPENFAEGNKVNYQNLEGRKTYRRMIGQKRMLPKDGLDRFRIWHFGIQGSLIRWPEQVMAIKSHVVFSEDGTVYESDAKQHAARRSQCRLWHNDVWLDRMVAAMAFLAGPDGGGRIHVPLSEEAGFTINATPMLFESPVSCFGDSKPVPAFDEDEQEDEEITEDEEE